MSLSQRGTLARRLAPVAVAVAALMGLACAHQKPATVTPRKLTSTDSAWLAQCYTPPETTATGHIGCVLRDQGVRIGPKPPTPPQ